MLVHNCKKILIANRSEIALRIQQTCKSLGIKTVAIYAPEDIQASYVAQADEAYPLSLQGFQAYLNQEEILAVACQAGVDAIHPGYGFLSESPSFAQHVEDAGIWWIGPTAQTMLITGDKAQARALMRRINVPINEGREFKAVSFDLEPAKECAQMLGYPVIIKDSLGGGGKAMRRVERDIDFGSAWHAVLSEGKRLGFAGNIIIEKYLTDVRHVEIQIAGDGERFIHLYERECSIQRRHQKIVEETPCRFVPESVLQNMYETAIFIARSVQYRGIGTVEFLVTPQGQYYFLEVNARLQVEHSITELTTGVDLVALQLVIATTNRLPLMQKEITRTGHAIECRVYAEDPIKNFLPSVGKIHFLQIPRGPFVRVDHDLAQGREITPFFDAMIAKISVFGFDRAAAIASMRAALNDFVLAGCITNRSFLQAILEHGDFIQGRASTNWLTNGQVFAILCAEDKLAIETEEKILIAAILQQALESRACAEKTAHEAPIRGSGWKRSQWK